MVCFISLLCVTLSVTLSVEGLKLLQQSSTEMDLSSSARVQQWRGGNGLIERGERRLTPESKYVRSREQGDGEALGRQR